MELYQWQLLTIGALACFLLAAWREVSTKNVGLDKTGRELWYVRVTRLTLPKFRLRYLLPGKRGSDTAVLTEERYLAGNRFWDEVYIDAPGRRIRMFLNVQEDRILLTVLKGIVEVSNYPYGADTTKRIVIQDRMKAVVGDTELEFIRKEMW